VAGLSWSVRFRSESPRAPRVRQSGFCSKKVRISSKRFRQFTIFNFWEDVALPRLWRGKNLKALFGEKESDLQTRVERI